MSLSAEQIQAILHLRENQVAPKQIARKLGLRPADVTSILREQAAVDPEKSDAFRRLPPLKECLINAKAAEYFWSTSRRWGLLGKRPHREANGMAQIVVTRQEGHRCSIVSYLIDYWCLGVKNTLGPRRLEPEDYATFLTTVYDHSFEEASTEISLAQAQSLIFGAVDYAQQLGFQPHPDFERAKLYLGKPLDDLPALKFGKNGKPFYFSGPYDNPDKVIAKLKKAVGEGNFEVVLATSESSLSQMSRFEP